MSQQMTNPMLPANATAEERALSLAGSFGVELLPEDIRLLTRPYNVPARFLPFLAWAVHTDYWFDDLAEASKRRMTAESWDWHRHKGTPYAIRRALETLGFDYVKIDEWFALESEPHTFSVEIAPMNEVLIRKAERCIREYKPARSHLLSIYSRWFQQENDEPDESLITVNSTELGELYPWLGAKYNGIHRYAATVDGAALEYSDPSECEVFFDGILSSFAEYLWAPYKYNSEYNYNGHVVYSTDAVEQESLATYQSVRISETVALMEGYLFTLEIFI